MLRVLSRILSLFACLVLLSCTSTTVIPQLTEKPTEKYTAIAIGKITMEGDLWQHLLPHLRHGMTLRFNEDKVFQKVLKEGEGELPEKTLVVNAVVTKVDEGSAAARFIIGFGAGTASIAGNFNVSDRSGKPLVEFKQEESYAGGAGIGGWDIVRLEELMKNLGQSAAGSITRWSQGKGLGEQSS